MKYSDLKWKTKDSWGFIEIKIVVPQKPCLLTAECVFKGTGEWKVIHYNKNHIPVESASWRGISHINMMSTFHPHIQRTCNCGYFNI